MKDLVASEKLHLVGITQEQHSERCRLFAQWREFDWPILHDPINMMNSMAVPIVVAIDEHGIVRSTRPSHDWVRNEFVTAEYQPTSNPQPGGSQTVDPSAVHRARGDELILWQATSLSQAVDAYAKAIELNASAENHFRQGVALRARYDSLQRKPSDFNNAVKHWTTALEMNPNQYIWRRRIQQYGPRLIKPYPFYDWVEQAQQDIERRGEEPIELRVPLSGAEVAKPAKRTEPLARNDTSPDPRNRITRDLGEYITLSTAVVPARVKPSESVRLHFEFSTRTKAAFWNNEAEPLRVWIDENVGWIPQERLIIYKGVPNAPESSEIRRLELEVQAADAAKHGEIRGYALYNVCEKRGGQCLLRRQDFSIRVAVLGEE